MISFSDVKLQDVTTESSDYTFEATSESTPDVRSLSFGSSDTYHDIVIAIHANDEIEGLESFNLTLKNPTAAVLCEPDTTTVVISDESSK